MNDYVTDQEQMEMLKKWWKDYGRLLLLAIIIGLAVGFGWRYWHQTQVKKSQEASLIYQAVVMADARQDHNQLEALSAQLMDQYKKTPYASLAAMFWAKQAVQNKKFNIAYSKLEWVLKNSKVNSIKQIARLRAARILLSQKKYQPGLTLLNTINDSAYQPMIDTIKGDIYTAMNKKTLAAQSYQNAKKGFAAVGGVDPILNLKLAS